MTKSWHHPFLNVRPARAVLETLLIGAILWLGLLIQQNHLSSFILRFGVSLFVGLICIIVCSLRLQSFAGAWWRQASIEVTIAAVLSFVLSALSLLITFVFLPDPVWKSSSRIFLLAALAPPLDIAVFIVLRNSIRLLLFWDRLRRTQLAWSLTHAHVMVVALGSVLLIFVVEILIALISRGFSLLLPTTLLLVALSLVALVIVVPPSALFSYVVIRRITRRLKTLKEATSVLRAGDYTVRVSVVGEDEVAQLQADFNAMAADLERAMRSLQAERDTVAGLLQSRRELIANVSHELRTPMATLRSYLETSLTHWHNAPPPMLRHDLQVMEDEAIRLQALVEDLFTLSRAEVGRLTLRCESTDIAQLVQSIVEARATLAWSASRVEVVADLPTSLPQVQADAKRLEQALQNLLHNAVRHTSPGGIVAVVLTEEAGAVVLQIKDTGEGIAAADLPHIWERFYQAENAHTRTGNGTGLGLALVKEWIEAMGGTVTVESVIGEGSCFTLRLPRACAG